jgi:hypothetical protein
MSAAHNKPPTRFAPRAPLRIVVFGLLLWAILAGLARLFDHAAKMDLREKARWIIHQKNGSYDFALLGSSRSYMGLDVFTLEKMLGQNGINLSLEGATYPEEYLALKLFLSRNQIKHLILDSSLIDFDNSVLRTPFHAYDYLPDIADADVFDSLKDNFGVRAYAWKYIPFFKNAEFNTKLGFLQFYIWSKMRTGEKLYEAEFDVKGSRLLTGGKAPNFPDESTEDLRQKPPTWNPLGKKYFLKILELARERGIAITMIAMPEYDSGAEPWRSRDEIMSFYESVARSNEIPFLRFDLDSRCSDKTLFLDRAHLNRKGALFFSEALANRLRTQETNEAEHSTGDISRNNK